jgi:hypothetical protein
MTIRYYFFAVCFGLTQSLFAEDLSDTAITPPGVDLQAVLDAGQDLL